MPPHHAHHPHHLPEPPDHFWFPPPDEARLVRALGSNFGRMAYRVLNERGAPPEHRILIELMLNLFDERRPDSDALAATDPRAT